MLFEPAQASLKEFATAEQPPEVDRLIGVRTRTGGWMDRLVPTFRGSMRCWA